MDEFIKSKEDGMKGWIGFGRTEEDKIRDEEEIMEMKEEYEEKFKQEYDLQEEEIKSEIEEFIKTGGDYDPSAIFDMPDEWVQMLIKVQIPETHLSLYRKSSNFEISSLIIEIIIFGISTNFQMG